MPTSPPTLPTAPRPVRRHRLLAWASPVLVAALVGTAPSASAQGAPWPYVLSKEPYARLGNRGYAPAVFGLLERADDAADLGPMASTLPDVLGTQLCYVGEHDAALEQDARLRALLGTHASPGSPALDGWAARPAVAELLERVRGRRVVMFNEEHRSSRQRAFLHELLAGLRAEGFTHLACETLQEGEALVERGYPVLGSGTYSRDPVFGDLLRRAVELGFTPVPYEVTPEQLAAGGPAVAADPLASTNLREAAQAENLAALLEDETARVVVFAGRHHIGEGEGDWTPMGARFAELTGVDPLTVDLMLMEERARPEDEHAARRAAREAGLLVDEPVVLVDGTGRLFTALPGVLDLVVLFPDAGRLAGRPDWLGLGGLRRPVVPEGLPSHDGAALLQALVEGEDPEAAVPADQVVVRPDAGNGRPPPTLLLRDGAYLLRLLDRDGEVVWTGRVEVP